MTEKNGMHGLISSRFFVPVWPLFPGRFCSRFLPPFAVRSHEAINERDKQPLVSQQNQLAVPRAAMSIIGLPCDVGAPVLRVSGVPSQTESIDRPTPYHWPIPQHCVTGARWLLLF